MILVEAGINSSIPDGPTPELVEVAALRHQDITSAQEIASYFCAQYADYLHLGVINITVLDVSDAQVRQFDAPGA
jgi:hypothetical protein